MKAHYKTADGRIVFEMQADTPKLIFEQIAAVQELFEAEAECGVCKDPERRIRFQVREVEGNKYYELRCLNCFARFQFGQHKQGGGLFPKRKDADGKPLPARGWAKYERKPQPAAPAPPTSGRVPDSATRQNGPAQSTRPAPQPVAPDPYAGYDPTDDDVPF